MNFQHSEEINQAQSADAEAREKASIEEILEKAKRETKKKSVQENE